VLVPRSRSLQADQRHLPATPPGDQLLVGIAKRLVGSVRAVDSVRRCGRNSRRPCRRRTSSCSCSTDCAPDADALARGPSGSKNALAEPFVIDGKELFASMSIGIALGRSDCDKPDDILRDADIALYQARPRGAMLTRCSTRP